MVLVLILRKMTGCHFCVGVVVLLLDCLVHTHVPLYFHSTCSLTELTSNLDRFSRAYRDSTLLLIRQAVELGTSIPN